MTRDPELQALVDRLREAGSSPETIAAAERYADADAEFTALLRADSAEAFANIPRPEHPNAA